jgi:2-desacetyl-2-hydroxyethyl bacteriochlorophyllide A dehydrogenase
MRAWLLEEPKSFKKIDMTQPEDKDKMIIKVKAIGICGSEMSAYKGIFPMGNYPRTLGHEVAGEVIYSPENVTDIHEGDKVVLEPYRYCGHCYPCLQGKTNCCETLNVISVHQNGAHMEYFAHDKHLVHKVPNHVSWEEAALVEPLTISIHGVHRGRVKEGEYVVITGAGPIGLLAAQYVRHLKAIPIMVDPLEKRLDIAQKMGINFVINPLTENAVERISTITNKRMAEAVIEASGAPIAIRDALDYVAYTGRISLVGYPNDPVPVPTFLATKKEIDILGSRNSVKEFPLAIDLIANGHLNLKSLITHIIDFEEIPEYFKRIEENSNDYLKVIAKI